MIRNVRILTDLEEPRVSNNWWGRADFVSEIVGGKGLVSNIAAAIRMLRLSKHYDVVLTSSSRKGNIFCILAGFCPGKKTPVVMTDCLWYKARTRLGYWLKVLELRLVARNVSKFIVWASHEVHDYSKTFSIPQGKFVFIPFHHTLEGFEYEISKGDYIFSGGDGDRDYETLIKAIQGLEIKIIIATRRIDWNGGLNIPPNIKAFPTRPNDFRKWMAGSKMVIVPMKKGLLHSGGQQTYLNAMAMGKPVIVADDKGAKDYIENGVNGLIVPAGNVEALRTAIKSVLDNPEFAAKLSHNAKSAYVCFSTPKNIKKILQTAEKIVRCVEKNRAR